MFFFLLHVGRIVGVALVALSLYDNARCALAAKRLADLPKDRIVLNILFINLGAFLAGYFHSVLRHMEG